MNLQTPIYGQPYRIRFWNALPTESRQAWRVDGNQVCGVEVGVGGWGERPRTSESRGPECLWWIHKVGLQLRAVSTLLKHRLGEKVKHFDACPGLNQRQLSESSGTMKLITSLLYSLHHRFRINPVKIRNARRRLLEWESIISPLQFLTYPYTVYLLDS